MDENDIAESRQRPRPRAVAGTEGDEDEHPGLERLLAYRDGELEESEADEMQEHLSLCPDCVLLLLEFDQFRADAESGERGTSDERRAGAWSALQTELRRERAELPTLALPVRPAPASPTVQPFAAPRPSARSPRPLYALAAILALVAVGLGLALAWSQSRYRAEAEALAQSRREAEELRLRLSEAQGAKPNPAMPPLGAPRTAPDSPGPSPRDERLAESPKAPGLPVPPRSADPGTERPEPRNPGREAVVTAIAVAVGPWHTTRGESVSPTRLEGGGAVNHFPAPADGRLLIGFDPGTALSRPQTKVTLFDAQGRTLWAAERLSAVLEGDLGSAAALTGLPAGRYRLRLEAVGGTEAIEYLLELDEPK